MIEREMGISALRKYLVSLPEKLHFEDRLLRINLYRCLYFALSNDGEFLKELFPNPEVHLPEEWNDVFTLFDNGSEFFKDPVSTDQKYSHPAHRPCARQFGKGDAIYRCLDCGMDDTCVLCAYCFNKQDHRDHTVRLSNSSGIGGICDCGDPEAFNKPLHCKCLLQNSEDPSIEPSFDKALKPVFDVCFDYILDIMNYSIHSIPFIHNNINKDSLTSTTLSEISSLPSEIYGSVDSNSQGYYLLLWNDENHNYQEAIEQISKALNCSPLTAQRLARTIDVEGRTILKKGKSVSELYTAQAIVETGGLVSTICTSRDYIRECMVEIIVDWLQEITTIGDYGFRERVKIAMTQSLIEKANISKPFVNSMIEGFPLDHGKSLKRMCLESGLLYNGEIVNGIYGKLEKDIDHHSKIDELITNEKREIANSRIQYLLCFDLRFWKSVRKKLGRYITPLMISDLHYKSVFCSQFVEIYGQLITSMSMSDRESHLNILSEVCTQLFTCPTSINSIIDGENLGNILIPIIRLLEHYSNLTSDNRLVFGEDIDRNSKIINATLSRGLHDINYIVEKCALKSKFLERENLNLFLLLFRLFQGYWPFERKYGDHVEHDIADLYIHHNYCIPVFSIIQSVSESSSRMYTSQQSDDLIVHKAISTVLEFLNSIELPHKSVNEESIMDFQVSKYRVSLFHPVNSFLSAIIINSKFTDMELIKKKSHDFLQISDVSLRSIVLSSQIKIGFWIRNGYFISAHANIYLDSSISEISYMKDIHLNQLSAIVEPTKRIVLNLLDRWELLGWFLNQVDFDQTNFEEKITYVAEEFIVFVYYVLTNRLALIEEISEEEKFKLQIKLSIAYTLCKEPQSYSEIRNALANDIVDDPNFDTILEEISTYSPPTGLSDVGMFRLKPDMYSELDPLSLINDTTDFQEISDALTKNIARKKKIKPESVVLIPQVVDISRTVYRNVGEFTRTNIFAKIIYKLLQTAIDKSSESYLPQLLHLVHAILIDDAHLNGVDHLPQVFIDIPISYLLLTIVESSMSKSITKKAEFLLDSFIKKDNSIMYSLVESMGEEHMKAFMEMRLGSLETENERKKRLAKSRQQRLMKKFAKQQLDFMEKNQDLDVAEKLNKNEDESDSSYDGLRVCIVCGSPESNNEVFGIPVSINKSSAFWQLPKDDLAYSRLGFNDWDNQSLDKPDSVGSGFPLNDGNTEFGCHREERSVASTCGHGLHYRCFKQFTTPLLARVSKEEFPCPLCSTIHNSFIPSFIESRENSDFDSNHEPINLKFNEIILETRELNCSELRNFIFREGFSFSTDRRIINNFRQDLKEIIGRNTKILEIFNLKSQFYSSVQGLSALIGNSISMNEIAARLEGPCSYESFLEQIPSNSKVLLKSLIQFRVVLSVNKASFIPPNTNEHLEIQNFWDGIDLHNGVFAEFCILFFQTYESFETLSRFVFTKYFTILCFSLLLRCDGDDDYFTTIYRSTGREYSKDQIGKMRYFLTHQVADNVSSLSSKKNYAIEALDNEEFIINFYYVVERCVLPLLRQLIIFSDNISVSSFQSLKKQINDQEYEDNSNALCYALNIPTIEKLLEHLLDPGSFEYKIFDNVISAKIPKYLDEGILSIEYPGMVRLINLPTEFSAFMDEGFEASAQDYRICLHCGKKLFEFQASQLRNHIRICNKSYGLFLNPTNNLVSLPINFYGKNFQMIIAAPYLTAHGETKTKDTRGKAYLNKMRYLNLNKLWINQGLVASMSRELMKSSGREAQAEFMNENLF